MIDTKMNPNAGSDSTERIVSLVPLIPPLPKRKRVAAYARVSVGKDAMLHSLAAQVSYYSEYIQKRPEWEYAGVYADEGLTGTKENRPEFQRLLADCRAGKIDMVIVKSISRFARNTVTMLATVRELKGLGIDILFEKENIHSMSGDGELMLAILASFAQEESLSVSENCKWRVKKKFEAGLSTGLSMYGYRMRGTDFIPIPEEAIIVKRIFGMYLEGMGKEMIAKALNAEGISSPRGCQWVASVVQYILQNEKYVGDLLLQKNYISDHLTKKKIRNRGQMAQYYVRDDHEPIIDRPIYEQVQAEMRRRAGLYYHGNTADDKTNKHLRRDDGNFLFSKKITCGVCGKHYKRKTGNAGSKYAKPIWMCSTFALYGKTACASRQISEKVLLPITCEVFGVAQDELPAAMNKISMITIYPDGRLIFDIDGKQVERPWANPSRKDSWNTEMRQQAREHAMKAKKNEGR